MSARTSQATTQLRSCRTCPSKFCTRLNWPYVGWSGILAFVWEIFVVLWLSLMLFDVVQQDGLVIMILLLITVVVMTILWLWNVFTCAPLFDTRKCDESVACPLIVKPAISSEYYWHLVWDARHKNDQGHLQVSLKGAIFSLLLFAIFVGHSGGPGLAGFDKLTDTSNFNQYRYYVMAKIFIGLVIASIGISFNLFLLETHTDFVVRHLATHDGTKEKKSDNEDMVEFSSQFTLSQKGLHGY